MSIGEISSIYQRGELDIHPEFQRFFRWSDQQKSDLVESILLGIPLPAIFVSQNEDGVWDVVDGLQRLSTIFQLQGILKELDGSVVPPLVLTETRYLTLLKGKRWGQTADEIRDESRFLTRPQMLDISRAKLDLKIILRSSDPGQEYDLFERLNTNGSPLSDQELRNNLLIMSNKDALRDLKDICKDKNFQACLSLSERLQEEQYDMELALRFLIMTRLALNELTNVGDLGKFITNSMLELASDGSLIDDEAIGIFTDTFRLLNEALGQDALRRFDWAKGKFMGPFLVSAFEVVALGVGTNIAVWREKKRATLVNKIKGLWKEGAALSKSRMGLAASTRIPITVPAGRKYFAR